MNHSELIEHRIESLECGKDDHEQRLRSLTVQVGNHKAKSLLQLLVSLAGGLMALLALIKAFLG